MWSPFGFSSHPLPFMLWASTSCVLLSLISMGLALLLCKVIPSTCPLECLLVLSCFLVSRKECHPLFVLYLQQCLHTLSISYKLAHTSHCLKQNSKNKTFHSLVPSSLLATTVFPSAQVFEWISGPCCLHFLSLTSYATRIRLLPSHPIAKTRWLSDPVEMCLPYSD